MCVFLLAVKGIVPSLVDSLKMVAETRDVSDYEDVVHSYCCQPVTPPARRNEVLGFIKQGLQDFSVSR